eukprot:4440045-Amphidinium_carterae.1
MILHLADKWVHLSDTHRESGLGWCLQYFDQRPADHSTWGSHDEAIVLNPRAILGTTGVSLHPSFRSTPDEQKLSQVREAYENDIARAADSKMRRQPGQTPQQVRSKVKANSSKDTQTRPGMKPTIGEGRRPFPFGPHEPLRQQGRLP